MWAALFSGRAYSVTLDGTESLVPAAGAIASGGTYALGKSADLYFFAGEVRRPEDIKDTPAAPPG